MLIQGLELVGIERNLLLWPYRISNEREAEMLYKTVGLAAASAVCALMVGCANTTTGKMVEPLEVMPTEVCIIQNPKVTIGEAIPSLQSAFQRRGIKTTVVRDAASCTSEYRYDPVQAGRTI